MSNEQIKQEAEKLIEKIDHTRVDMPTSILQSLVEKHLTSFAARARNEGIEEAAVQFDKKAKRNKEFAKANETPSGDNGLWKFHMDEADEQDRNARLTRLLKSQEATDGQ